MIGSTWAFGPADTPWYKKAVESLTKEAKCSIHFSVSNQGLSVHEFLTVCNEVSNLMNEPPIGVKPSEDSIINVLTPNSLLLGRATTSSPLGWQPYDTNTSSWYHLVQSVVKDFWKRWTEPYVLTLLLQRKWHTVRCNWRPEDVVIRQIRTCCEEIIAWHLWKRCFQEKIEKCEEWLFSTLKVIEVGRELMSTEVQETL